jgi:hypothetical protein
MAAYIVKIANAANRNTSWPVASFSAGAAMQICNTFGQQ